MNFIEYTFETQNSILDSEFLIALLYDAGFEGFTENDSALTAYLPEELDSPETVNQIVRKVKSTLGELSVSRTLLPDKNWNEQWEKGFQPINIRDKVYIRAPFHESKASVPYDLIIEPKMSFGTGHHETTRLMINALLEVSVEGSKVLDIGCGTGILSVFASKRKAESILSVDIDSWAVENCIENAKRNACENISIQKGTMDNIEIQEFDIILANINTNVLIQDMENYYKSLTNNGILIISGIMSIDVEKIRTVVDCLSFELIQHASEGDWHSLTLRKSSL